MSKIALCTPSASKMVLNGPHLMGKVCILILQCKNWCTNYLIKKWSWFCFWHFFRIFFYWPKMFSRFLRSKFYIGKFFTSIENAIFLSWKIAHFGLFYCVFTHFMTFWLNLFAWNELLLGCYDFLVLARQVESPLSHAKYWK